MPRPTSPASCSTWQGPDMALVEPVVLEPAATLGPVHFIAMGGAGMSGIAQAYADLGVAVSGSDRDDSPALRKLAAAGVRTSWGTRPISSPTPAPSWSPPPSSRATLSSTRPTGAGCACGTGPRLWAPSCSDAVAWPSPEPTARRPPPAWSRPCSPTSASTPAGVIGSPLAATGESAALGSGGTLCRRGRRVRRLLPPVPGRDRRDHQHRG